MGFTAIINDAHWGFLFHNEIFKPVRVGLKIRGYIKQIRDDGKIDLSLTAAGYGKVDGIAETILNQLDRSGGFLPLTAKTSPEELSHRFGVSKKNYKKALGALYKQRLVAIEPDGIRLLPRRPAEGTPDDEQ